MFDLSWSELLLIGVVALIFIGPKELPGVLRTLGQWMSKIRRMAGDFQNQFHDAMREAELADLKKEVDEMAAQAARYNFDPLADVRKEMESAQRDIESTVADKRAESPAVGEPAAAAPPAVGADPASVSQPEASVAPAGPPDESPPVADAAEAAKEPVKHDAGKRARMTTDERDEIEATKAPLIEHLVELRSRLIKALVAFMLTFVVCFFFARQIYNILTFPYVWVAGAENSKFIYTGLLEYFIVQLKLAMFGAAFLSFPVVASQLYMFVAPGLYRNEKQAFLPYLVATPFFFLLGSLMVYFLLWPLLARFSLSMQQAGGDGRATIELLPKVDDYLSLMMRLIFAFGIAFQLPVILTLLGVSASSPRNS